MLKEKHSNCKAYHYENLGITELHIRQGRKPKLVLELKTEDYKRIKEEQEKR